MSDVLIVLAIYGLFRAAVDIYAAWRLCEVSGE